MTVPILVYVFGLAGVVATYNSLFVVGICAAIGIFLGTCLNRFVPGQKLKPAFGWFVLALGSLMLIWQLMK